MLNIINIILLIPILIILIFIHAKLSKKKIDISKWFKKKRDLKLSDYEAFVYQLAHAIKWTSDKKIGALIIIEKGKNLDRYISLGYQIQARLTAELLISVFSNKNSSLHDGGVIIRGLDIVALSSYFPVTQTKLVTTLGARHRAAAGLTENSDAVAFVVSETTGRVSISTKGEIHEIYSGDVNSLSGEIFDLLNFYMD